jgi:hypothetical protein
LKQVVVIVTLPRRRIFVMIKGKVGRFALLGVAAGAFAMFASISTRAMADKDKQRDREMSRLSAQYTAVDGNAILLPSGTIPGDAGQIEIYSNTLTVPKRDNTLYVSVFGEGLGTCDGFAFLCQVDGVNCVQGNALPGPGLVAAIPPGWVIPLGNEFESGDDFGLTGFSFQFCAPTTQGSHSIAIHAASSFGSCDTFIEGLHVYVDSNHISDAADRCATYATPNPATSPD